MFRVSQYMNEVLAPRPLGPARKPPGPVVIWNLIRRCNLACKHCYSISANYDFAGELSTEEVYRVMDDLHDYGVRVLILSGGEPLMRPDIFDISRRARDMGFYVGLSTNGTLIDSSNIDVIADIGYDYVGISLDGIGATHDRFRRMQGAFDLSMEAVRLCRERALKVGLRFTLTQDNAAELPRLLALLDEHDIEKFYISHLNYAGRGDRNRASDTHLDMTRTAMNQIFDAALSYARRGIHREFVTGNNDADGVYLLLWVREHFPERAEHIAAKLRQWGGNSSGVNVANIDNLGNVHPDTMWWNYTLGNVRERPFGAIWNDTSDPVMAGLKQHPRPVRGRCGECRFLDICNGNTRVRALQLTGDPWEEDPACYLSDEEIGVVAGRERLKTVPYQRPAKVFRGR
ncbi:heme d1 biosynthesis radical SAM protein NirJ [Aquisalimonas sp.]|uniref:heme d1 biosynthesis radical SAM protein NirJ n=1 Tax=Aquisalimonas sp. TaxID=1872621 RepID=UPI0025BCB904|nr:heme d1 biosynthesis radical SAM protein NirJ [Aquisalimonas sp.]